MNALSFSSSPGLFQNHNDVSRLFDAVRRDNPAEVKSLLGKNPALIKEKLKTGDSLLHVAATNGHELICCLLLSKGHEMTPVNSKKETPYQVANEDVKKYFQITLYNMMCVGHVGGDEAAVNLSERTPELIKIREEFVKDRTDIVNAILNDKEATVFFLLTKTPQLMDAKLEAGNGLLHLAARNGYHSICKLLLEKIDMGYDTVAALHRDFPVNNAGETPFDVAKNPSIKQLLAPYLSR